MRLSDNWKDYELIDTSDGERLERWGDITLIRPDPQVIWNTPKKNSLWKKADAVYHRSNSGGGSWEVKNKIPDFIRLYINPLSNTLPIPAPPLYREEGEPT